MNKHLDLDCIILSSESFLEKLRRLIRILDDLSEDEMIEIMGIIGVIKDEMDILLLKFGGKM